MNVSTPFKKIDLSIMIRRYIIFILVITVLSGFITYYIATQEATKYEARSRLLIGPGVGSPETSFDALRIGEGLVQTYSVLAETHPVLQNASDKLNLNLNAFEMDEIVEVLSNNDTRIITIYVQYENPEIAVKIANEISKSLIEMSPSTIESASPTHDLLGKTIEIVQASIMDTEAYIEELELELDSIQEKTKDISIEDLALIKFYTNLEDDLSLERSRLSDALRSQSANFGTMNEHYWVITSDISSMKSQVLSHINLSEQIILDSNDRIENLSAELANLGSDYDFADYVVDITFIERQNEIEMLISQERARLSDQTRTLSFAIGDYSNIPVNPNQVTFIEPADVGIEVGGLELKVVTAVIAGLIAGIVLATLIEVFRNPQSNKPLKNEA